jgi:hypothetical protein
MILKHRRWIVRTRQVRQHSGNGWLRPHSVSAMNATPRIEKDAPIFCVSAPRQGHPRRFQHTDTTGTWLWQHRISTPAFTAAA